MSGSSVRGDIALRGALDDDERGSEYSFSHQETSNCIMHSITPSAVGGVVGGLLKKSLSKGQMQQHDVVDVECEEVEEFEEACCKLQELTIAGTINRDEERRRKRLLMQYMEFQAQDVADEDTSMAPYYELFTFSLRWWNNCWGKTGCCGDGAENS